MNGDLRLSRWGLDEWGSDTALKSHKWSHSKLKRTLRKKTSAAIASLPGTMTSCQESSVCGKTSIRHFRVADELSPVGLEAMSKCREMVIQRNARCRGSRGES